MRATKSQGKRAVSGRKLIEFLASPLIKPPHPFHQQFHEETYLRGLKVFRRDARSEAEPARLFFQDLIKGRIADIIGILGLDQAALAKGKPGGALGELADGEDPRLAVHVQGLEEGLCRDLREIADHAGGQVLGPDLVGFIQTLRHQAGEVELDSRVVVEDLFEVVLVNVEDFSRFGHLDGGADIVIADQAHLSEDVALAER
jgi:hypothetical protein